MEPGKQPTALIQSATAGYFQSLHIPLRAGRLPAESDGPHTPHIAAVSESMVRRWWPDGSVIGRRLQVRAGEWVSIVGVVGDIEQSVVFRGVCADSLRAVCAVAGTPDGSRHPDGGRCADARAGGARHGARGGRASSRSPT